MMILKLIRALGPWSIPLDMAGSARSAWPAQHKLASQKPWLPQGSIKPNRATGRRSMR